MAVLNVRTEKEAEHLDSAYIPSCFDIWILALGKAADTRPPFVNEIIYYNLNRCNELLT